MNVVCPPTALESTQHDNCTHGSLQLVNRTSNDSVGSGRLEICLNQAWGTVCSDQFRYTEAEVSCRQLEGVYAEGMHNSYIYGDENSSPLLILALVVQ